MEYLYGYEMIPSEDIADYFTDAQKYVMLPWEDRMGMKVTSGVVTLEKDHQNLVGVSIGGGAPNCPCIYIVQIFDNTPASKDGTLAAGDEIVGINGVTAKCRTKSEVARMIQMSTERVSINYNKLHADPKQGKTLDLVLKKVKHRVVESMTSGTADALGLSRAILCNDSMVKKLEELEKTEVLYRNLALKTKGFLKAFFDLSRAHRAFGDVFSGIGVREPLAQASLVFSKFGDTHRELEKNALNLIKVIKPMMSDLSTYLCKAIPDTKLTIKKYLDSKFEYLSYCLKVKEMDDEEYACNTLNEYLYRVETGNYEYRLVLRCRQEARSKFAKMRNDVLVKLELLDNKRVQDMVFQLQRFVTSLARCHADNHGIMKDNQLFPIEVDLSRGIFDYNTTGRMPADEDRCDEDEVSSVDTSPGFISTIKEEAEERPSVERDDELVEIGNDEFPQSLLLDSGDQEDSPKLEKDLFDFFLDSPIGLSANSSISSILKKSSEQHSKVPLESDFNPFESLEEKVALFREKEGVQGFSGWFGEASDTNNNSNAAVQDSPRNCYKDKDHKLPSAKGDDALESSNLGDPTSDQHIRGKIEGVDSNNNGGLEAGDDLDEDFFFEAISSRFPSEEFIKDFMVGTRTSEISKGDVSDKDDNDDKMLEFEEDDKILTDAGNPSNDVGHPPAIDHDEASKDDALIEDAGVRGRSRSAEIQSDDDALLVCVDSP